MLVQHRTRHGFHLGPPAKSTFLDVRKSIIIIILFFSLLLKKTNCFILDCYREYEGAMKFKFNQLPKAEENQGCQTTYFEGHVTKPGPLARSLCYSIYLVWLFPVYPVFPSDTYFYFLFLFCVSCVYLPSRANLFQKLTSMTSGSVPSLFF